MSLLVSSLAVAGGIFVGRWIARSLRPRPEREEGAEKGAPMKDKKPEKPAAPPKTGAGAAPKKPAGDPLAEFPCHLGDVVIGLGGEEAWLAGALVLSERTPAALLFVAPDAGGDRALYVRAKPSASILWLLPVPPAELTLGAEPPSSLEHKGTRFERLRRVPFRVERIGTGAPDVGDQAIVAEYSSGNERLVAIAGGGNARAWRGAPLEEGTYDILPSGKATLDA